LLGLSDAGAHTSQLCDANAPTHLLGYWMRERGALSLEDAVWRLSGQPAEVFGLRDRGVIRRGAVADLVAFDPATVGSRGLERVRDLPGGADRVIVRSVGVEHVWVGGTCVRRDGVDLDGVAPGRLLRNGAG
jgi:N-acyl-D-aspartate/D-glutamate deacylase